jgi:dienelactone hydrolase
MSEFTKIGALCIAAMANAAAADTGVTVDTPVPYVTPETPTGTGQFKSVMESDPGLPTHTVYRPADLNAWGGKKKLPILVWGNGACSNIGNKFRRHLAEITSHGYLAIAIGPIGTPKDEEEPRMPPRAPGAAGAPAIPPAPPAAPPPGAARGPATRTAQLIEAIDWAVAENGRLGSKYKGKLDTSKIAIAGQSCGGVQAIEASADTRIKTSMIFNSGLFAQPSTMAGGALIGKDHLAKLHAPIAYISGDPSDIAFKNADDDYERINHIPVFRAYEKGIGHNGTHRWLNGGDFAVVSTAWLDWQLKGDPKAARMFKGADCTLCTDPRWVIRKKMID